MLPQKAKKYFKTRQQNASIDVFPAYALSDAE